MRFLIVVICMLVTGCGTKSEMTLAERAEREVTKVIRHGNYVIKIQNWPSLAPIIGGKPAEGILNVKHNNCSRTLRKAELRYYFDQSLDLTGDSEDDLVFYSWSGGAHGSCDLIIFDSKINKFHVFYFSQQLGTENGFLKTFFKGDMPYTFKDMDNDGVSEILILYQWPYYGTAFAFSPQYLKIYSLRGSKVLDVTHKFKNFIARAIIGQEGLLQEYREKWNQQDIFHAKNLSILLMKLYGGLETETAWEQYNTVRREIGDESDAWSREHVEKAMIEWNDRLNPYIE